MGIDNMLLVSVPFISILLTIFGVAFLIWGKRKKWLFVLVATAFLPVLLAAAAATMDFAGNEARLENHSGLSPEAVEFLRFQNRRTFTIQVSAGAICTAVPLILGGLGLLFKRNRDNVT